MSDEIVRVPTGIYGLDPLIEGGIPKGRTVLVSGGTGTGKTIFSMQYVISGAEHGEPGVYVTLDEHPDMIRQDMLRFGWDIRKHEKKGNLAIVDVGSAKVGFPSEEKFSLPQVGLDVDRLLLRIMQIVDQIGATRLVIDSFAGLGLHMDREDDIRKTILKINYMLKRTQTTALVTSEIPEQSFGAGPMAFSKYGIEEYVADGVIVLHYLGIGTESNRSLFVRKMRGTKHNEDVLPMEITKKGIMVKKPEEAYKV
ncbi:AAA family ATPase [Candidatus Micrarchaeota archaeon]|nr:AAA family ATPase [Candidatus Micrarchaeota archaeon]